MRKAANIYWLGVKELRSFCSDYVLLALVVYAFSLAVIMQARSNSQELHNASIAIVDEDNSELSRRIAHAFLPPLFQPPQMIVERDIVPADEQGRLHVRDRHSAELPAGRSRGTPAGRFRSTSTRPPWCRRASGPATRKQIVADGDPDFVSNAEGAPLSPVNLDVRIAFNPNVTTAWFTSVMGIINSITMLAIILAGAAIVREREHGTMDHLLVMPLTPFEIAMSKVWANGLVITVRVRRSRFISWCAGCSQFRSPARSRSSWSAS